MSVAWEKTGTRTSFSAGKNYSGKRKLKMQWVGRYLRTATVFTTTSVDWEKTGTRTSVSAGKRKLKVQSVVRSTTTTLNVNTNVNCDVRSQQGFSQWHLLKQRKILFFKPCA